MNPPDFFVFTGTPSPHLGISGPLLSWYRSNRRDLPWRRSRDPYAIWVSEAMLQQTQVATVIDYWLRWMALFPTVEALARADEQAVLAAWQGLGYYRRCRLLHAGARWVAEHGFPTTVESWRKVPGVGPYTAGAISSIAQGFPAPLVDGNVERVYARLNADSGIGQSLNRNAWIWARRNLNQTAPGDWNQALMELGATVCLPARPRCDVCPIRADCQALSEGRVEELPIPVRKRGVVSMQHACVVPIWEDKVGVRQIPQGLWWQGMWEFPRVAKAEPQEIIEAWPLESLQKLGVVRHTVTHHRIALGVWMARLADEAIGLRWIEPENLSSLPMPSPQRKAFGLVLKHCF